MYKSKREKEKYKNDVERRAFSVLASRLILHGELTKGEALKILSGVRKSSKSTSKLTRNISKRLLRKWHKLGLIVVFRNKIRLCFHPLVFKLLGLDAPLELLTILEEGDYHDELYTYTR